MEISIMHAGLAAGAALAAIPVVLHLFMRQTPKHVIFPALRLIRERHKRSKKQLKIKNWLLLAARMLLLILMALALARPALNSESSFGDQEVPTALAFVFDTSLSMQYVDKGKDRLAEAKERAGEILKKATEDSEVYVFDSADPVKPAAVSPSSARKRIEGLELRAANRPLNDAVVQANQVVAASNLGRREVFVLTDLAGTAWELGSTRTKEALAKVRDEKKGVRTFVLKLTPKEVKDVAVIAAEPLSTVVAEGEPVEIKATLRATGPAAEKVAEFWLDGDNKKDQKLVKIPANGEVEVTFTTPSKLETGLHQGRIKLSGGGPDFLAFNNERFFSFNVQPAMKVLVVSNLEIDGLYVEMVLAPASTDPNPPASPFKVERESRKQFQARSQASLKDFAAIFLVNLDELTANDWGRLSIYVRDGGGLVVSPGDRSDPTSYGEGAASVLPAALVAPKAPAGGTTFGKAEYDHPLFNRHPQLLDPVLTACPVYRYWTVKPLDGTRTILRYADHAPAVIERTFKGTRAGHSLLWTTPLSRRPLRDDPASWNELANYWAFLEILWQTVPYLAGIAGEKLNYDAGQDAILTVDPARKAPSYFVQGPDPKLVDPRATPSPNDMLLVPSPQKAGQWKVEGKGPDGSKMKMGFSVNVPAGESQLAPLREGDLEGIFGAKDSFRVAETAEGLREALTNIRVGFEIFPYLMFLILALVTAENLLANKFHRETARVTT